MIDMTEIKNAAYVITDDQGKPIVQLPLEVWEALVTELAEQERQRRQERLREWKETWEKPLNEVPPEWWDEYDAFIKQNRVDFGETDF